MMVIDDSGGDSDNDDERTAFINIILFDVNYEYLFMQDQGFSKQFLKRELMNEYRGKTTSPPVNKGVIILK